MAVVYTASYRVKHYTCMYIKHRNPDLICNHISTQISKDHSNTSFWLFYEGDQICQYKLKNYDLQYGN